MVSDEAKLESVQLEATRIVTGAMRGKSNAKLYQENWMAYIGQTERNIQTNADV